MKDKLQSSILLLAGLLASSAFVGQQTNATHGPANSQQTSVTRGPAEAIAAIKPAAEATGDAAAVIAFEKKLHEAIVRGDTPYVSQALSDDFIMVHGDHWITGGNFQVIDNKQSFLKTKSENRQYLVLDLDSIKVEMHGDIAITNGRYIAESRVARDPSKRWFSVWFERIYAKRNGKWVFVSHRTVHGPTYGPDRASVSDK